MAKPWTEAGYYENIEHELKEICSRLRDCVVKHKLGHGGENVDELVIAELESVRSRNSELVEGIKKLVARLAEVSPSEVNGWQSGYKEACRHVTSELRSLLPPDPATTNSKEKT